MPQADPRIAAVLDALSQLLDKDLELVESDGENDISVHAPAGALSRLALRTADGSSFAGVERLFASELLGLIARDLSNRADLGSLEQRLGLLERENAELMVRNRALTELSVRDSLTGLYTRWYLLDKIESEMNRALRHEKPLTLMMLDLDHFKQVNDSFGHPVGDRVLQVIGQVVRDSCRVYDIPGRYGGEEFCLLLPETTLENTYPVAERIRKRVENTPCWFDGAEVRITTSVGIAGTDNVPSDALFSSASLIERADRALYAAKESGRNRIEAWSAALPRHIGH